MRMPGTEAWRYRDFLIFLTGLALTGFFAAARAAFFCTGLAAGFFAGAGLAAGAALAAGAGLAAGAALGAGAGFLAAVRAAAETGALGASLTGAVLPFFCCG